MKLTELLAGQPPVKKIENARKTIRKLLTNSGKRLVIIDDDPTGPQAVHDVPVFLDWSIDSLRKGFGSEEPVFFINTNSRSLSPEEMRRVSIETGRNLREAAGLENTEFLLTSRSDSTLRGHFPGEIDALLEGTGLQPDGIILVPAFFEGGRYTIDTIHYAEQNGDLVPVHLTEFARDPAYTYTTSNLKTWVEEKTAGRIKADNVVSLSLRTLREGGPDAVTDELVKVSGGSVVTSNATCYEDLEILSLGISQAEARGKTFVYRCSASFIKARGGFYDKPLLTACEMKPGNGAGLIIAGSYVEKTSRQLQTLLDTGLAEGVELHTDMLVGDTNADEEIQRVIDYVNNHLSNRITTAIYTTRTVNRQSEDAFRQTGKIIMDTLCRIVRNIENKPGFVIAKGGITSIEIARTGLDATEAYAIGQILGGVPVWLLSEGARWTDIPYVVFPGNVGDENALLKAVKILLDRDN